MDGYLPWSLRLNVAVVSWDGYPLLFFFMRDNENLNLSQFRVQQKTKRGSQALPLFRLWVK